MALTTQSIEKALALCGKTMEEMKEFKIPKWEYYDFWIMKFSIEKFCYYLLSPEFIEKYWHICWMKRWDIPKEFWYAIYEFQKNNPKPLIGLLSKI